MLPITRRTSNFNVHTLSELFKVIKCSEKINEKEIDVSENAPSDQKWRNFGEGPQYVPGGRN